MEEKKKRTREELTFVDALMRSRRWVVTRKSFHWLVENDNREVDEPFVQLIDTACSCRVERNHFYFFAVFLEPLVYL